MRRVAILFNHYGNPNQPFLSEWVSRIIDLTSISIKSFTDRFHSVRSAFVVVLKEDGMLRYWRYLETLFLRMFNPDYRGVTWQLMPLVKYDPDIIHLLNAQQWDQYHSVLVVNNRKVVTSFRGFETSVRPVEDADWAAKLLQIYEESTALHFVSDFLKNEAIKRGAPENKCVVIRRSVDTSFFKPKEKKASDGIHFIAVGRLTWQKGYSVLLRAFAQVVRSNNMVRLTVVGAGPDEPAFINEIKTLGISEHVTHYPFLDRNDLREVLWQSDIFVQASLSDALPNSVLEASACGLPVVSTRAGGIPEAVDHGKTGILVEPGNSEDFAKAMILIMNDEKLRSDLSSNGRSFILEHFSAENENRNWENFYFNL